MAFALFWRGKPGNVSLADCCAEHPVAFHGYKRPRELAALFRVYAATRGEPTAAQTARAQCTH